MLYCPFAVDHPSLLEPLREAATAREYVKTSKSLNLREVVCQAKYARLSGRDRNLLKLLCSCIEPLQGLELQMYIWTHLLEEKSVGSFLAPFLNHFIVSTRWEELEEANISCIFQVDIHIHRGAIDKAVVTLFQTIQTQVSVFWKCTLNSYHVK